MGIWTIEGGSPGATINESTGEAFFPKNIGATDITYTIKYTEGSCSKSYNYTIPKCAGCDTTLWSYYFDMGQPAIQDLNGTGGTPVVVVILKNDLRVENLTLDKLVINIGEHGEYNDMLDSSNPIVQFQNLGQGRYMFFLNKNGNNACKYYGQIITCTIAPKECPDAVGKFSIYISETYTATIKVEGMPADVTSMIMHFIGYVGVCEAEVQMGGYTIYKESDGYGYARGVNLYRNMVNIGTTSAPEYIKVSGIQLSNYCEDPINCAKILEYTPNATTVMVKYCPGASGAHPCQ